MARNLLLLAVDYVQDLRWALWSWAIWWTLCSQLDDLNISHTSQVMQSNITRLVMRTGLTVSKNKPKFMWIISAGDDSGRRSGESGIQKDGGTDADRYSKHFRRSRFFQLRICFQFACFSGPERSSAPSEAQLRLFHWKVTHETWPVRRLIKVLSLSEFVSEV